KRSLTFTKRPYRLLCRICGYIRKRQASGQFPGEPQEKRSDERQEPDHDLRPERRRDLRCRIQDGRGRGARNLDPENRGGRDRALPGAYALWAVCAGGSVRNIYRAQGVSLMEVLPAPW